MGQSQEDSLLFRTMNAEKALEVMDSEMTQGKGKRAWLHLRYATTGFTGLNGTHGFAAGDFTVFHSGCLSRKQAQKFKVDSELIAADVENHGVKTAIKFVAEQDPFANIFVVNNKTGTWHMYRNQGGSLHADGQGNYSTHAFATITMPVPPKTWDFYNKPIVSKVRRVASYMHDHWGYAATHSTYSRPWSKWLKNRIDDENKEVERVMAEVNKVTSAESMDALAKAHNWYDNGIPEDVWDSMSATQLQWAFKCTLLPKRA